MQKITKRPDAKIYSLADLATMNERTVYCPNCKKYGEEDDFAVESEEAPGMLVCPDEICNTISANSVIRQSWFSINEKNQIVLSIPKMFWEKWGWVFDDFARNTIERRITIGDVIWQAMNEYGLC